LTAGALPASRLGRATQVGLFLLASLPFLIPLHIRPITTFYNEWWAGCLALVVITLAVSLRHRKARIDLPFIVALPMIFIVALGIQAAAKLLYFPQQGLIYALYLLLAVGMMVAGRALADELGEETLADSLAGGFLFGALLQVASAVLQLQGTALSLITSPLVPGYSLYGNLGQQNHLAHVLWLGLASLLWLHWQARLRWGVALLCAAALLLIAPFSGSRSIYLYPLGFLMITGSLWHRLRSLPRARPLLLLMVLLVPATWGFNQLAALLPQPVTGVQASSADRLFYTALEAGSQSIRLGQWRIGLEATLDAPWLGNGVGSVPLSSLEHVRAGHYDGAMQVSEHYHNIIVNWLVEFGIPVTLAALACVGLWLYALLRAPLTPARWWLLAMLSVTSIHSLLEYPLWHAYFLAPTALLLGAFSAISGHLRLTRLIRGTLILALALAAFMLHTLRDDHLRLARVIHIAPSGPQAQEIWRLHIKDLLVLHKESMFSPYVNGMLVIAMDIDRIQLNAKRQLCDAALNFSPAPGVLFKCAAIRVLAGENESGTRLLQQGLFAFPDEAARVADEFLALTEQFPELKPLQRYAETRPRR
jgi:O-antigen ligase